MRNMIDVESPFVKCGDILMVIAISVVMTVIAGCLVFMGLVYQIGHDEGMHPVIAFSLAIGAISAILPLVFSLKRLRSL